MTAPLRSEVRVLRPVLICVALAVIVVGFALLTETPAGDPPPPIVVTPATAAGAPVTMEMAE